MCDYSKELIKNGVPSLEERAAQRRRAEEAAAAKPVDRSDRADASESKAR